MVLFEISEIELIGLDLVLDYIDKVELIWEKIEMAQSCAKFYSNISRRHLELNIDNPVYLKVSNMKGLMHFCIKGKLSPCRPLWDCGSNYQCGL